jgi:hypothetical protein
MFSQLGKFVLLFFSWLYCVPRPVTDFLRGNPKTLEWTSAAEEDFQGTKNLLARAVPLQHLSLMVSFLWPLTPPIPISEASCDKNQKTIGVLWVSFPESCLKRNLVIPLLTRTC